MTYTDVSYFPFIPNKNKILILKGKRKLTEKDYNELIKISNKPADELQKIEKIMKNLKKVKSNTKKDKQKKQTLKNLLIKIDNKTKLNEEDLSDLNKISENDSNLSNSIRNSTTEVPKILRDLHKLNPDDDEELDEEEMMEQKKLGMTTEKKVYNLRTQNFNPNIANRLNDLNKPISNGVGPGAANAAGISGTLPLGNSLDQKMENQMNKVGEQMTGGI